MRRRRDDPMSRLVLIARGLAALAVLAAMTVGLPLALYVAAGSPVPHRLPVTGEIWDTLRRPADDSLILGVLRDVAWLLWAVFTVSALTDVIAQIRGRTVHRLPGLGALQHATGHLVTSAVFMFASSTVTLTSASTPIATAHATTSPAAMPPRAGHAPPRVVDVRSTPAATDPQPAAPGLRHWYTVEPGDDLWSIAHHQLGDAHRYREIYDLNEGRLQPDGNTITDPNLIQPGWRLLLPSPSPSPSSRRPGGHQQRAPTRPPTPQPRPASPGASPGPVPSTPAQPSKPAAESTPTRPARSPSPTTRTSPLRRTPPATAPASREHVCSDHGCPTIIRLPSGAIVGLSFAAGTSTALIATRLHRRRRHRIPPTGPSSTTEPEPTPTIRALRRADLARRSNGHPDPGQASDDRADLHLFPARSSGMVTLGTRDGNEVTVPIGDLSVGLTGPGSHSAARALLLGLLTHAGDNDAEIIIPGHDLAQLLDLTGHQLRDTTDHISALVTVADLDTAIRRLETERIHRARTLDAHPHTTLTTVRDADPAEPLPRLVLIATPHQDNHRRLEAIAAGCDAYDIGMILLGEHPAGATISVDTEGNLTEISRGDPAQQWTGLHLWHVTAADAREVLAIIRTAHGAPEPEPDAGTPASRPPPPPAATSTPQTPADDDHLVQLRVLGPPTLTVAGTELATGIRGKARELLTYLALRPDGATRDAILEALYPEIDQRHAVLRFHAAVNDIRKQLRDTTSLPDDFITHTGDRYRIDPSLITVDLWRFQRAVYEAGRADNDVVRTRCLHNAADAYADHLAAEQPYEWIEPEREALRRQAIETLAHLADHYDNTDPDRALAILERAKDLDRHTEDIYRRIMIVQHRLGRPDAIRRTHRLLETNLEELGVDPTKETEHLVWRLLHPRQQHSAGVGFEDE